MTANQLIKYYANKTAKVAAEFGVTQQTVRNWQANGVPLNIQRLAEFQSGGALKASRK